MQLHVQLVTQKQSLPPAGQIKDRARGVPWLQLSATSSDTAVLSRRSPADYSYGRLVGTRELADVPRVLRVRESPT